MKYRSLDLWPTITFILGEEQYPMPEGNGEVVSQFTNGKEILGVGGGGGKR